MNIKSCEHVNLQPCPCRLSSCIALHAYEFVYRNFNLNTHYQIPILDLNFIVPCQEARGWMETGVGEKTKAERRGTPNGSGN